MPVKKCMRFGPYISMREHQLDLGAYVDTLDPKSIANMGEDVMLMFEASQVEKLVDMMATVHTFPKVKIENLFIFLTEYVTLNVMCMNRLYCNNKVDISPLFMSKVMTPVDQVTLSSVTNQFNTDAIALMDACALLTNRYKVKMGDVGRREMIHLYNALCLTGFFHLGNCIYYRDLERACIQVGAIEEDSDIHSTHLSSVMYSTGGKWWDVLANMKVSGPNMEAVICTEVVLAISHCIDSVLDNKHTNPSLLTVLQMIMTLASNSLFEYNPVVTSVFERIFSIKWMQPGIEGLQCNDGAYENLCCRWNFTKSPLSIPCYTGSVREAIRLFKVVEWFFPTNHLLTDNTLSRMLRYLNTMPFIAYDMLSIASRLIFNYIIKVADDVYSTLLLESIVSKIHCGDSILSILLLADTDNVGLYASISDKERTRARLQQLDYQIIPVHYTAKNTILGKNIVMEYICDAIKGSTFVKDTLDILMCKITPDIIVQMRMHSMIDFVKFTNAQAMSARMKGINISKSASSTSLSKGP